MKELSILTPVYNARCYLDAFIKSIVDQHVPDAEYVFVDDCSTDGSLDYLRRRLKDYGLDKSSIVIANFENRGVSEVRQKTLEVASGKYVIFADSDDTADSGMYNELLLVANKFEADLVWEDFFENGKRRSCKVDGCSCGSDLIHAILRRSLHGALWNKLMRRDFIQSSGARFLRGRVSLCEDVDFLCQVLIANPKCHYNASCHYRYANVASSATHGLSESSFRSLWEVEKHLRKVLPSDEFGSELDGWDKGHRLTCFMQPNVTDDFFYSYLGEISDLKTVSAHPILKMLFKLAVWGRRGLALKLLKALHR